MCVCSYPTRFFSCHAKYKSLSSSSSHGHRILRNQMTCICFIRRTGEAFTKSEHTLAVPDLVVPVEVHVEVPMQLKKPCRWCGRVNPAEARRIPAVGIRFHRIRRRICDGDCAARFQRNRGPPGLGRTWEGRGAYYGSGDGRIWSPDSSSASRQRICNGAGREVEAEVEEKNYSLAAALDYIKGPRRGWT